MLLFVNESHFAHLLAGPLVHTHASYIRRVVFSTKTRGRLRPASRIVRRSSTRYVAYRLAVDAITRFNDFRGRGSVLSLCRRAGIPVCWSPDVNRDAEVLQLLPGELGVVVNFDQILHPPLLRQFTRGVLNTHASKLPNDRGISPALWAFARGDQEIWTTIYQLDPGLDTGPVYDQFAVNVRPEDTAFSVYERICRKAGLHLAQWVGHLLSNAAPTPNPQEKGGSQAPLTWPDHELDRLLARSGRRLIGASDIRRALSTPSAGGR